MILVYFVGGVTYAEISCLRYLSSTTSTILLRKQCVDYQFVVATTQIINGNKLVDSFKDEFGSLLKHEAIEGVPS